MSINNKITNELLIDLDFKKQDNDGVIENITLPYYVNDGVCLFYNKHDHEQEFIKTRWLGGYIFTYQKIINEPSKYYAATFYWMDRMVELDNLYKGITGRDIIGKL
jgi:hypothetical protein